MNSRADYDAVDSNGARPPNSGLLVANPVPTSQVHLAVIPRQKEDSLTTTLLIRNIHCASCVSYIQEILHDLGPAIYEVDTSVLIQKTRVVHQHAIPATQICQHLSDAGFEVYNAVTMDGRGKKIEELDFASSFESWLEAATIIGRHPQAGSSRSTSCLQLPGTSKRSKHIQTCLACQKGEGYLSERGTKPTSHDLDGTAKPATKPGGTKTDVPEEKVWEGDHIVDVEPTQSPYKAILSIGGMTCASCTRAITEGVEELPFVDTVNVTLMTNSAQVIFAGRDNLDLILEKVDDLGYDATVEGCIAADPLDQKEVDVCLLQRTVMLRINGMYCEHCPRRIVDCITSEFASSVTIDKLPTTKDPTITFTYTPKAPTFTIRTIIMVINSLDDSFSTIFYHPPSLEERSHAMRVHEQHRILIRLLLSFIVAIPTLVIGVVLSTFISPTSAIRKLLDQPTWSGQVTRAEWALFICATPVYFFAADVFHLRAIAEVRALWSRKSKVPVWRRFYRFGSMNLLISAGTSVAYISSLALLIVGATTKSDRSSHDSTYFDTVVFLTFFILIGRFIEAYSKAKTGDAVSMLGKLRPTEALLLRTKSLEEVSSGSDRDIESNLQATTRTQKVNVDYLENGDIIVVPHGSSPPADGVVHTGSTKFDESSLTGESRAVGKAPGDKIFAGTVNIDNPISMKITEVHGSSMLDQIISVVREGQTKRAPVERVADILTGYFVPVITLLAIVTFVIWFSLGRSGAISRSYLTNQQGGWAFWSLEFAIAVFVVACPCGIGLAAPTALFVGGGLAAKSGILVRGGGEAFQEASDLDAVVFDKTGTLTEGGDLKVTNHEMLVEGEEIEVAWSIIKAIEETSSHPIARAILRIATAQPLASIHVNSITERPGLGLQATFMFQPSSANPDKGELVAYEAALGSESLMSSLSPTPPALTYFTTKTLSTWKYHSKSVALLGLRRITSSRATEPQTPTPWALTTLLATTDPIRPSALHVIKHLRTHHNLSVYMLTGDNPTTAHAVAQTLGVPIANVIAGVLPAEKAAKIQWLQDHCPRRSRNHWFRRPGARGATQQAKAKIAFVGDGINDAPALASASVSVAIGSGSDIALSSSSFILLSSDLGSLLTLLDLSKRVFRRVRFNFAWALGYNLVLVPVAAGVLFWVRGSGWRLGPVWASAAMAASSVSVVVSSLALRWGWG
ncbi:MAG: copper resistance-associated P-type ATPase [Lasallia pustulata]|uniref:Copper resistance-associated P-type ATPase n=1 Tax=Lasallia pustulata TaxID=136370 RepID=A0A5M8Q278_9LECA|nr:MAG: copper resistance-associated P-type ATPase [Lasallia pustulata]